MANQELRVGSRWKWMTPYELTPFTYIAPNRIRYDGETQGHWDVPAETVVARAVPLPAPAAETPAALAWTPPAGCTCTPFEQEELCPHHGRVAPPPPRCAPGCTPAHACRAVGVCPAWREDKVAPGLNWHVPTDIPPAREPRIGALSWGYAAVCGGLSTRRGR